MIGLLAHGLCCPLGPADVAAAAQAAGLSRAERFAPAPVLGCGEDAAPAVGHAVLPPEADDRPAALLRLAWAELQRHAPPSAERVLLCLPIPDPLRWGPGEPPDPTAAVRDLSGIAAIEPIPLGHAAAAAALQRAEELITTRTCRRVLVAAADSLLDQASLAWLAADDRLRGPETPDGVQPGEAAAWWLLGDAEPRAQAILSARRIAAAGRAPQDDAERLLAAAGEATGVDWTDANGEMWRARAYGRLGRHPCIEPAACWGELGACSALAAATLALRQRPAVVWSLADDGAAGVIRIT